MVSRPVALWESSCTEPYFESSGNEKEQTISNFVGCHLYITRKLVSYINFILLLFSLTFCFVLFQFFQLCKRVVWKHSAKWVFWQHLTPPLWYHLVCITFFAWICQYYQPISFSETKRMRSNQVWFNISNLRNFEIVLIFTQDHYREVQYHSSF